MPAASPPCTLSLNQSKLRLIVNKYPPLWPLRANRPEKPGEILKKRHRNNKLRLASLEGTKLCCNPEALLTGLLRHFIPPNEGHRAAENEILIGHTK